MVSSQSKNFQKINFLDENASSFFSKKIRARDYRRFAADLLRIKFANAN